ncbi:MAG: DUF418 domain-containing protein [Gloeobacteraceae cyanobacterium ES-bin-316]|nr:DUF418 domain-containing protein [Ferruginibacter sp.]
MKEFKENATLESRKKRMEKANRLTTGTYEELYNYRTDSYINNLINYTYLSIWDVLLFMFIGMAFFKTGVLTGTATTKLYALMCIGGMGLGLLISYYQLQPLIDAKFNRFEYKKNIAISFYEAGRTLRSLGFLGLLMLLHKSGIFKWFFKMMRPVGQMAFTNYLSQSIIGACIFYGIGFGLFGKLQRYEVYGIVMCIWLFQIVFSHVWMHYFLYGPFEWLWRSLTYWKKQPFIKNQQQ